MIDTTEEMNCHSLLRDIGACVFLSATASTLDEKFAFQKREAELLYQLDTRCGQLAAQLASRLAKNKNE